ncbi:MAG: PAS domain-containing protein, partial [Eubacteriales bacterium]|nr:PAS domain-containing protein [Eubacteriales bacterium]
LTNDEWRQIAEDSDEIGYTLIRSALSYPDKAIRTMFREQERGRPVQEAPQESLKSEGVVQLPSGVFSLTELTAMLNALPFDITFVDKDDIVKYFSQGSDRIFERTRSIIGRKVINCHPPASMHVVEEILADFKAGKREHADFWIKMGPRYVLIRYFAVRDPQGEFLGTLEVTQDIAPIQAIDGEKRLLDEG